MHSPRERCSSQGSSIGDALLNVCYVLLLLVLLATPKPGLGQQDQDNAFASVVAAAQRAQGSNDYAGAVASYKRAVELRRDIPELWANLGLMQHESQDYSGAVQSFQQAVRLKPSLYVPQLFLGVDFMRMGDAKAAIPYLLRAEMMNGTDGLPPLTLGRAYAAEGRYVLAAKAYERAIHLDSGKSSAWFGLGIARLDEVEEDARKASEGDQSSAYVKALYAESLVKQARYNEAVDVYKGVLAMEPRPPCVQAELGFLLLKQKDAAGAEGAFDAERRADAGCSLAMLGEARMRLDAGAGEDALRVLDELWKRDRGFLMANAAALVDGLDAARTAGFQGEIAQKSGEIASELSSFLSGVLRGELVVSPGVAEVRADAVARTAQVDYWSGRYGQCAIRAREGLKTKSVASLQLLATCAYFTGDYDLASNAAEVLGAVAPQSVVALYWSIKANERLAFSALERYQQLEPNSSRSHLLLGDIYRQRTRFEDALGEYEKALAMTPNDPAALMGLASAYFGNGNMEMAKKTAQMALDQTPSDPELNLLMAEVLVSGRQFAAAEPYLQIALHAKPQMLPHVHALLGQVYADAGKTQPAIDEFLLGIETDRDGSLHYQLARLYRKNGDDKAAAAAIEEMKKIEQQRRERAVTATRDAHSSTLEDGP
jgi:tetratricopeptide (TPR) repeat protein